MGANIFKSCACSDKVVPSSPEKENQEEGKEIEGGDTPFTSYRTCTDVIWLIILLLFMIPLAGLLIYCIRYGDIYRIFNGYDRCGNVCGRVTERFGVAPNDPRFTCLGADMTKRRFLLVRGAGTKDGEVESNINRECVQACSPGYKEFLNRCIPDKSTEQVNVFFSKTGLSNFFQEVAEDLDLCWREILALCFIALGFSLVLLLLLRFAVGLVVWVMLGAVVVVCFIATGYLWIQWAHEKDKLKENYRFSNQVESDVEVMKINSYLGYAIVASVITLIILLLVIVMRSRVRLVVQLFEEAGKAISDIPSLLALPIITFIFLGFIIAIWLWLALWIESSGILTSANNVNFNYKKDDAMKVTRWYNLLAMFWLTQFVIGTQHMIVAGAVAMWYFCRNKSNLSMPILTSTSYTVRYHLGSVCFGSLLVAIVQFVRVILHAIQSTLRGGEENWFKSNMIKTCSCCLMVFEKVLAYLNRNAYIETAMRGCNFLEGGQRAFKLLGSNALRVAAINSVGDFVLFLGKVAVVLSTMLVGIQLIQSKDGVQHMWVPITLACLFSYLVAHTFMTIYEMSIDTIFLCFCEDIELNDGITKPYYMSSGLMEFVDESGGLTRPSSAINGNSTRPGTTILQKPTAFVIEA